MYKKYKTHIEKVFNKFGNILLDHEFDFNCSLI